MAARTLKPKHQDEIREKIKGTQLIRFIQEYALTGKFNDVEVKDPKRIDGALGLLRKVLPDLSAVEAAIQVTTYRDVLERIASSRLPLPMPSEVANAALLAKDQPTIQ